MKTDQSDHPTDFRFEQEMATYRYTLRLVLYLVIPLLSTLMVFVVLRRNYPGIAILMIVLVLNIAVLVADRTRVTKQTKIRMNRFVFKTQVFLSGAFLLYMIAVANQWELVPWTFAICYLAFVILGFRAGTIMAGLFGVALLVAYRFTATPERIVTDDLMFRFFPAFALITIVFAGIEYIRNDYRRKLANANRTLTESKDRYRRLYERLAEEVSDREQAEAALLGSEARFRLIAENVADVIWTMDMDLKFDYINPAIIQQRGYTVEEAMQHSMDQVVLPDYLEGIMAIFAEKLVLIESGNEAGFEPVEFEVQQSCKDGSVIWTSNHARIMPGPDKKATGILGITRDITARRQTEEKLARSKKMESLGLLAGGVAHDLNNILSGIVSYPELLLLDLPADSKFRQPIETIQESGHRAAAIVQDLLTVARGVAVAKEPLNLNALVRDYLKSPEFIKLQQMYPAVLIDRKLNHDLLEINGSQIHLRKVVMNLVSNAAEAAQGAGQVVIATENRYLDKPLKGYADVDPGEYAVLSISDDGPGISADDLERIFEPFYTKKAMGRSGTGLGLAVVWNTVQDHKGYINLVRHTRRTTFEIYFPITREEIALQTRGAVPLEDYRGNGERILVVDDVQSQREISCRMLETLGYNAQAVSGGEQAVAYLQTATADLVLLDMIMEPGINGRQTYEKIKKIHPRQKAILVSGYAKTEEVQKTQALGAGKYIKKPFTLKRLGMAVKEELDR